MTTVTVVVPMTIRHRGGRKQIIGPDGAPVCLGGEVTAETRGDPVLVKALARAFRWRRMLEEGQFGSIQELAAAEKINPSYVSRVLRLTLLAPDIVEAILDGRQPEGMSVPGLMKGVAVDWARQNHAAPPQSLSLNAGGMVVGWLRRDVIPTGCRDLIGDRPGCGPQPPARSIGARGFASPAT